MKRLILVAGLFLAFCIGCTYLDNIKQSELLNITSRFIDRMDNKTVVDTVNLITSNCVEFTKDGKYKISQLGRLINIEVTNKSFTESDYEDLADDIRFYYSDDPRVRAVYVCGYGTIMIDCRYYED